MNAFLSRVTTPVRHSHFFFSCFSTFFLLLHHLFLMLLLCLYQLFCLSLTLHFTFQRAYTAFESSPSHSQSLNVIHHHHHLQCFHSHRVPHQSLRARTGSISHSSTFMWSSPYTHSHPTFLSFLPTFLLPASFPSYFSSAAALIKWASTRSAQQKGREEKKNLFSESPPFLLPHARPFYLALFWSAA